MRILFLTAYYPPCEYGWGYMQLCARTANALHARGHSVQVLTSTYRHGDESSPFPVHRLLDLDPDWHSGESALGQFFFRRTSRGRAAVMCSPRSIRAWVISLCVFAGRVGRGFSG